MLLQHNANFPELILWLFYTQRINRIYKLLTTIYLKNDILNTNSSFYPFIFYTTDLSKYEIAGIY